MPRSNIGWGQPRGARPGGGGAGTSTSKDGCAEAGLARPRAEARGWNCDQAPSIGRSPRCAPGATPPRGRFRRWRRPPLPHGQVRPHHPLQAVAARRVQRRGQQAALRLHQRGELRARGRFPVERVIFPRGPRKGAQLERVKGFVDHGSPHAAHCPDLPPGVHLHGAHRANGCAHLRTRPSRSSPCADRTPPMPPKRGVEPLLHASLARTPPYGAIRCNITGTGTRGRAVNRAPTACP